MLEKKRVFLLNDEQKILVFLNFGYRKYVPKIIIPNFDMPIFDKSLLQNGEDFEYITENEKEKEQLVAVNNCLRKTTYTTQNIYYATTFELTEEMRNNINNFCENQNFIPDFMSIEEIEKALKCIRENYENARSQKSLEESLQVLKRKLTYEEY